MNKKQQELESVPEPQVSFVDMTDEHSEVALHSGKMAYLAKDKGRSHTTKPKYRTERWNDSYAKRVD